LSERDVIGNAAHNALRALRESGYEISERLQVAVDPELPFMGYAMQRSGGHVIVVSVMALKSGLIEGLLIHEMCHVYRTETNHPSHNRELLHRVEQAIVHEKGITEQYQVKVIQRAVNHVQDLYADDIAFKVFQKTTSFTLEQAHNFFLEWIKDKPLKEKSSRERWLNIGTLLNNCFAISNLKRHNIPDIDNQAENKVQKFLSQTDDRMKTEFGWFRNFMTNLKENTIEQEFEKYLIEYLTRIKGLAEKQPD